MDLDDDSFCKSSKNINIFHFTKISSTDIEKYISSQFDMSNSDDNSNSNYFSQGTWKNAAQHVSCNIVINFFNHGIDRRPFLDEIRSLSEGHHHVNVYQSMSE